MMQTLAWANHEFGKADIGDKRRTRRLVAIIAAAASQIGVAISSACGPAGALAASRLFRRRESTIEAVLRPHIKRTGERCESYDRI